MMMTTSNTSIDHDSTSQSRRCASIERAWKRTLLSALVFAAASLSTGCSFFLIDSACHGFEPEDPLMKVHLIVWAPGAEPGGPGAEIEEALHLEVGHGGEASLVHDTGNRALLRARCRPLDAADLDAVMRAVERLERVALPRRLVRLPGCRHETTIVLRNDHEDGLLDYCGATPPPEVTRFLEEIFDPLENRFGKELTRGLAALAPHGT